MKSLSMLCVTAVLASSVFAGWSTPLNLSNSGSASLYLGMYTFQNRVYVVWSETGSGRIRSREFNGSWQAVQNVSSPSGGDADWRPRIAADPSGNLHCVWFRRIGTNYSVYYAKRTGTSWGAAVNLSGDPSYNAEVCDVAVDGQGRVHVVWDERPPSTGQPIRYRIFDGTNWIPPLSARAEAVGGSNNAAFPGVVVDSSSKPHVVWQQNTGDGYDIFYSEKSGANWLGSPVNISPNSYSHTQVPQVAVDSLGRVHIVWQDANVGDPKGIFYRRYEGSSWTPPLNEMALSISSPTAFWPDIAVDGDNFAHVAWESGNPYKIVYSREASTGWKAPAVLTSSTTGAETPCIAVDAAGTIHVVYGDDTTGAMDIYYISKAPPLPPDPVTDFEARGGSRRAVLSWTNPTSTQFTGTMIRMRTDAFPSSPTDGTLVVDKANTAGSADSFALTGVSPGSYRYAAFTHDITPVYSAAVTTSVCVGVAGDFDADEDVDMKDFGHFQECLTGAGYQQDDEACADARLDADADVDEDDFNAFQKCLSGAGVPADPTCAN